MNEIELSQALAVHVHVHGEHDAGINLQLRWYTRSI